MSTLYHLSQPILADRALHCAGAGVYFSAVGDDALVSLSACADGVPTGAVLAVARVTPQQLSAPGLLRVQWAPVLLSAGSEYAIIVTAGDTATRVGIGQIGAYDAASQQYMGEPPYHTGLLSAMGGDGRWQATPDTCLTFELLEAVYPATSEPIELGTVALVDASDLAVRADVASPEPGASVVYKLALDDGRLITVDGEQRVELPARYSGNVAVTATLRRGARLGPTLQPGAVLVHGHVADQGTYISPVVSAAGGASLRVEFDALLPAGAAVHVHQQLDGGAWQAVPYIDSSPGTAGVMALTYGHNAIGSASTVRVRLTLDGTPAARPLLTNLRVVVV